MDTLRILSCGSKRLIALLALLVLSAWAQGVYADNTPTFGVQANIDITTTAGFAENVSTFQGPGVNLTAMGGGTCPELFCAGIAPGSSLNPSVDLDFSDGVGGTVTLGGGQQIDCQFSKANCLLIGVGIAVSSSIKLPTNGQNFAVTVPAALGSPIMGVDESTNRMFNLQTFPGQFQLFFAFDSSMQSYKFVEGVYSTPEPGTLGLMAAGLAGILGLSNRRKRRVLSN